MITLGVVIALASMTTSKAKHTDWTLLMAVFPSISSLTVTLSGHSVTTAISIFTVTALSTVRSPVTSITHFPTVVSCPAPGAGTVAIHGITEGIVFTHTLHLAALTEESTGAGILAQFAHVSRWTVARPVVFVTDGSILTKRALL